MSLCVGSGIAWRAFGAAGASTCGAVLLTHCTADPTVLPGDKELGIKLVQLRGRLQGYYCANACKCK